MTVKVQNIELYIHNIHSRMPFRYGIAELSSVPHLFVQVTLEVDGKTQTGIAADSLIPKWFTKDADTAYQDDLSDMLAVIQKAGTFAVSAGAVATVFDLWQQVHTQQKEWAQTEAFPPLLWNFGVSLIERALIDAFCRATATSLSEALRQNTLGIKLGDIHTELADYQPVDLLPAQPLNTVNLRHTIGLSDSLTEADIPADERTNDGLPQSLEACIRAYGLTFFKIKVGGQKEHDLQRLCRIDTVLRDCGVEDYYFTLDGNEQYKSVEAFREFWDEFSADTACKFALDRLLFVEQPLHRSVALAPQTQEAMLKWEDRPPTIIDESDSELHSLRTALECGYIGTSHKNCKGIFKGIANACLIEYWCRKNTDICYVLSGEDLCNVGPVALVQDLNVMANLGIEHVERNGHHYFTGLSVFPEAVEEQILTQHNDLYRQHEQGFATLNVTAGMITLGSVITGPPGPADQPDLSNFIPVKNWNFASLELPEG